MSQLLPLSPMALEAYHEGLDAERAKGECPDCGRDNSAHGNVCTAKDCPGNKTPNPHQSNLEQAALDFYSLVQGNSDEKRNAFSVKRSLQHVNRVSGQWEAWEVAQELRRERV